MTGTHPKAVPGNRGRQYGFDADVKARGRVVLVVDDSAMMRFAVAEQVRKLDHDPVEVGSGAEVEGMAVFYEPRLIVLDIQMPGMSGLDALMRLRGNPQTERINVMMVTVESHSDSIREAHRFGVQGYLIKPYDTRALRSRLELLLQ